MEVGAGGRTVTSQTVAKGGLPLPKAAAPAAPPPAASNPLADPNVRNYLAGISQSYTDAQATFMATMAASGAFNQAELSQIASWATGQITGQGQPNNLPVPEAQVALNFSQTPMFQQRFPGMAKLEAQGLSVSPAQYVNLEQGYAQTAMAAGLPSGVLTRQEMGELIGNNVSIPEFNQRVTDAAVASSLAKTANPDVVSALKTYYGVSDGDLTHFFLDPTKNVNLINQRTQTAQIGGAAQAAGFNPLALATAANLEQQVGNPQGSLSQAELNAKFQGESGLLSLAQKSGAGADMHVDQGALAAQALGVANGAQQRNILGAAQNRAGASSGGGGYAPNERGSSVGSASEGGAKGDVMSG